MDGDRDDDIESRKSKKAGSLGKLNGHGCSKRGDPGVFELFDSIRGSAREIVEACGDVERVTRDALDDGDRCGLKLAPAFFTDWRASDPSAKFASVGVKPLGGGFESSPEIHTPSLTQNEEPR